MEPLPFDTRRAAAYWGDGDVIIPWRGGVAALVAAADPHQAELRLIGCRGRPDRTVDVPAPADVMAAGYYVRKDDLGVARVIHVAHGGVRWMRATPRRP